MAAVVAIDALLHQRRVWKGQPTPLPPSPQPTGVAALDAALPTGGWPEAALSELLIPVDGVGELQLLWPTLARLSQAGERIVLVAPPYVPFAPAWQAAGIELRMLQVVEAATPRDALWAITAGARALEPERSWTYAFNYEQRFGERGLLNAGVERKALLRSAEKGALSYRETFLGGCAKPGSACPLGGISNISGCAGHGDESACEWAMICKTKRPAISQLHSIFEEQLRDAPEASPLQASLRIQLESAERALYVIDNA